LHLVLVILQSPPTIHIICLNKVDVKIVPSNAYISFPVMSAYGIKLTCPLVFLPEEGPGRE